MTRSYHPWTMAELKRLEQVYPTVYERSELKRMFAPRSWRAIQTVAWRLKLRRASKPKPACRPLTDWKAIAAAHVMLTPYFTQQRETIQ